MAKRKTPQTRITKNPRGPKAPGDSSQARLYTLEVRIIIGPAWRKVVRTIPKLSRTIEIRGNQTLEDLHFAIFDAFDREDEHLYEFQFGSRAMEGPKYVLEAGADFGDENIAGLVDETTIDSLELETGRSFFYWFDFGDDWWHQIKVKAIDVALPGEKYPKLTNKEGKSPPQYPDLDEEDEDEEEEDEE